ncbi:hypothetical protein [Acinetobacter larvae]|uniref:Preprotein translocase subunit SecA n=1 Tax=Acinetobacter larvae TaxID=1789224 RepID=A0A1B2M1M4_9GAMM|nr:hypothetical protein [Acinetobacter larvae]AOA59100.1 preprotein translocase subunit SecA [Acinetobacter larvae]
MSKTITHKLFQTEPGSLFWRLNLAYDIFMLGIIVINLCCLFGNAFMMSHFASWFFDKLHLIAWVEFYRESLNPWVLKTEGWFISFLLIEFAVRWGIAIAGRHHERWFFFPFIHWYEVLAIIPVLRFLRLLRAGIIAYRLHQIGYQVIPTSILKKLVFYYELVMEELSDRVVVTVINGIQQQLAGSNSHREIIHQLVAHHQHMLSQTLAELLQENLAVALEQQQQHVAQHVGQVVNQAIVDTPELHQLLRLMPFLGGRLESQLQQIGQRLGENISHGLMQPFITGTPESPNLSYQYIAETISHLDIKNQSLERLVASAVSESLEAIKQQVQIKQWKVKLTTDSAVKE